MNTLTPTRTYIHTNTYTKQCRFHQIQSYGCLFIERERERERQCEGVFVCVAKTQTRELSKTEGDRERGRQKRDRHAKVDEL